MRTSISISNQFEPYNAPKLHFHQCKSLWTAQHAHRRFFTVARAADAQQLTVAEVQQVAASRGVDISLKTLGPVYRITCREGDNNGKVIGATSGFIIPFVGLMHCDTLQIFTKGLKGDQGDRLRGGVLGLGLLLGATVFAFAAASGCKKAEILAINDDEATHRRLVRYYQRFGFTPVYEVTGGSLADLPHMLVWGGVGTRMDADVHRMLQRWAMAVRNSGMRARSGARREAGSSDVID